MDGGVRAKLNFTWMATASGRPFVAPERRTIFVARGTSNIRLESMGCSVPRIPGWHRSSDRMGYRSQQRFGMYRWHIMDPIRFREDLRVTIQALGWRSNLEGQRRYLPLQDDIASTAFWYQAEPHAPFPALPDLNALEVI